MKTMNVRVLARSVAWMLLAGVVLPGLASSGRFAMHPLSTPVVQGQEAKAPADGKSDEAKVAKKRAEPRGRLPAYFGEVVSNDQREKIYDIQAKYLMQIGKLQDEIAKLEESREKDVLAVLTEEQMAKVKQLQNDAKAKRAAAAATRKKGDAAPEVPSGEGAR